MVSKRTRNKQNSSTKRPRQVYKEKLQMSAAKKADLLSLVASGTIPKEFEAYYQSLPSSKTVKDKLPCPSVSESDESD